MIPLRADALMPRLRDLGLATPEQLREAQGQLEQTQERFSAILVQRKLLRDADAGKRMALQLGAMPQKLADALQATAAAKALPVQLWRTHRVVPVREENGKVVVATDDPLSAFALEFLSRRCGSPLEAILVREEEFAVLLEALERLGSGAAEAGQPIPSDGGKPDTTPSASPGPKWPPGPPSTQGGAPASSAAQVPRAAPAPPAAGAPPAPSGLERQGAAGPPAKSSSTPRQAVAGGEASDEPIIRLVDSMLSEAGGMRASDVHIEPGLSGLRVRYRIDGVLRDVNSPPKALHGPVVSRIKIMAALNIAEKRLPQDGRLQIALGDRPLDVRVSILPAMHGESIVMRLLDRSQPIRGLLEMGMLPENQQVWESLIRRPHGIVLVTGPTGSGKTTTLYGALSLLNQPEHKLITVEDPVEYQLQGVNQVLVRPAVGLTFAAGLRAMLRQAPDIIMVGEIRDQETAQIAIQAALTGHLVLSTLHTNDASSAITRLIDMGIAPFLVASTVQGVLAQRLVRRLCERCRVMEASSSEERAFLREPDRGTLAHSAGCEECHQTGFSGRVGIFELLVVHEAIRKLVVQRATASAIRAAAAQAGMRGIREDGCEKIRQGLTTLTEVLRVVVGSEEL